MATPVKMPQLGESVTEGTIVTWLKHEGDTVEVDEPIVEISTEKVDTEIPSPVAGVLSKVVAEEGDTVEVGKPLCEIEEGSTPAAPRETPAAPRQRPAARAPAPERASPAPERASPAPERATPSRRERPAAARGPGAGDGHPGQVLSPLVRRLARDNDVDVSRLAGSGAGGRVTRQDVLDHVQSAAAERAVPAPPVRTPAEDGEREEARPLDHIRRRIAEHMSRSLQVSARAWNAIEVDMENVARIRSRAGEEFRRREGFSLTYLPFIARACIDALAAEPLLNATVNEEVTEAILHRYVNLGVAVAVDYGLIVPVVKGAEGMNVLGLARTIHDLAERARTKKLSPDEVTGSTFTITNPGPFGSVMSLPIINQPNVAILSTEAVEKRVVVVDDLIGIRHRMFLCMSWDHRLVDGSDAVRFLAKLKENLQTWDFAREI